MVYIKSTGRQHIAKGGVIAVLLWLFVVCAGYAQKRNTVAEIKGNQFYINGKPSYPNRYWKGHKVEGLLMNSRMVQGIFDDANPETRTLFNYPDTKKWDADRNTSEFVRAMREWQSYGLNAFTINLQGGSPVGYGNKNWRNSAFDESGKLRKDYLKRLDRILQEADDLGMVVLLGYFYFGQDEYLNDEKAVLNAVDNATAWILKRGYRNVIIEVNNECDINYDYPILQPERVHELMLRVKHKEHKGHRLLVSTSYGGGTIPKPNVVRVSDFILLHGNGVSDPARIPTMVENTKRVEGYTNQPIVFNEDDHYDFDKPENNFVNAVKAYASWGFFDFRRAGEGFEEGYQSVPVDWGINSDRKKAFFNKVKEITGR
jgi:hypothetical protein